MMLNLSFFAAALLYSAVGHAGASGYLAAMAFAGVEPHVMRPTALVLNLVVGSIAFIRFTAAGYFSWSLLWPFSLGSVPLAFIGGGITLPGHWYRLLVGVVLFAAAVRLIVERKPPAQTITHAAPVLPAIIAGGVIGLLSGLTGTGGGIFSVRCCSSPDGRKLERPAASLPRSYS